MTKKGADIYRTIVKYQIQGRISSGFLSFSYICRNT